MRISSLFCVSLFIIIVTSTHNVSAENAGLLLYPTRLVLEKNERSATINLKNNGEANGAYKIELIDMVMEENGVIREVMPTEKAEFSAKDMIRIAPRSVSLMPAQDQNIRLLIRKPDNVTQGEYRSHLRVTLVHGDYQPNAANSDQQQGASLAIKPKLALVIPIILRFGQTSYQVTLANPAISQQQDNSAKYSNYLSLSLQRTGDRSAMGDIEITWKPTPDSNPIPLAYHAGVPVYRPTAKRLVHIPLDVPKGQSLQQGTLTIRYLTQEQEGRQLIHAITHTLP
jgi:hypothetical protein